jgi:prefoldin beta subunit
MDDIPEQLRNDIQQLQSLQQQLQSIISQRQQFELQLNEIESALKEIEKADDNTPIYRSIGAMLIKVKSREEVKNELSEQKDLLGVRVNSLKKQEEMLNGKIAPLAQRVSQGLQRYSG